MAHGMVTADEHRAPASAAVTEVEETVRTLNSLLVGVGFQALPSILLAPRCCRHRRLPSAAAASAAGLQSSPSTPACIPSPVDDLRSDGSGEASDGDHDAHPWQVDDGETDVGCPNASIDTPAFPVAATAALIHTLLRAQHVDATRAAALDDRLARALADARVLRDRVVRLDRDLDRALRRAADARADADAAKDAARIAERRAADAARDARGARNDVFAVAAAAARAADGGSQDAACCVGGHAAALAAATAAAATAAASSASDPAAVAAALSAVSAAAATTAAAASSPRVCPRCWARRHKDKAAQAGGPLDGCVDELPATLTATAGGGIPTPVATPPQQRPKRQQPQQKSPKPLKPLAAAATAHHARQATGSDLAHRDVARSTATAAAAQAPEQHLPRSPKPPRPGPAPAPGAAASPAVTRSTSHRRAGVVTATSPAPSSPQPPQTLVRDRPSRAPAPRTRSATTSTAATSTTPDESVVALVVPERLRRSDPLQQRPRATPSRHSSADGDIAANVAKLVVPPDAAQGVSSEPAAPTSLTAMSGPELEPPHRVDDAPPPSPPTPTAAPTRSVFFDLPADDATSPPPPSQSPSISRS
ncbi:hypothetical protein HK405_011872, partial [Cladochytrium tenue]